jgi:lactate 2-monooxygenase
MPNFGDYQNEIYFAGLSGALPSFPMRFEELEARAREAMPASVVSYVAGGCGDERTQDANVAAFGKWGLVPRMLVGATERDLSIGLFGMKLPTPLFMSPIGVIGLCAQDGHGDIATARAAAKTGVPMVASTLMVDPLEEGALADLLLVDGNPLADIKLIEDPAKNFLLIMKYGRVYKDLALD